ncbi:MAG: DUF5684 domain-containing protein [Candidatus Omnitrophica bacterium]|nr:DUF5684 domain-containing protein [Candidatus Omnitrophota bacterium]
MWKVYHKAGYPGWAILVPIYNLYVSVKIAGYSGWLLLLFFVPFVNIVVNIIISVGLAKRFDRGAGFGLGLAFLPFIFYPILAFSSASYSAVDNI